VLVAIVKETRDPMSRRPHEKSREGCYLLVKKGYLRCPVLLYYCTTVLLYYCTTVDR